jgi:ribosomal protein S18 acetylase RimI-like enzyme
MASSGEDEIPLLGGDVTEGLVRVGGTVRRPPGPHSSAIAAYLRHLEVAGFSESPRHLGIDDRGRDILSFVEGETAGRPLHAWAAETSVLVAIAALQRRLHDLSPLGLDLPEGAAFATPVHLDGVPDAFDQADVIGHNDLTPDNLIFRQGKLVGVIDFDLAGPTTRLLDVVTTLLYWAPLRDPVDRDPLLADADAGARMRLFCAAYGLTPQQRRQLYDLAVRRQNRSWHVMKHAAQTRGGGWARMWDEGVGDVILRSQRWLADNEEMLRQALAPTQESADGFAPYAPGTGRRPSPADLRVREALPPDVEGCVAVIMAVNGGDEAGWRAMFHRTLAAADQALLVADVGGEIVGYARVVHHGMPAEAPVDAVPEGYYLMGLAVAEHWRRRGLAEALTRARLRWAWSRTDRVWYFASADNPASLDLHRGLGFREHTREFAFPGVIFAGGSGVLCVLHRPGVAPTPADGSGRANDQDGEVVPRGE